MNIHKILLTGDDGYNSVGTRLLVKALKDHYDLTIAATLEQQSAMGGRMNLHGFEWGRDTVDGVAAYWVNGSPVDAIELIKAHFPQDSAPFDLVISGINWGANLSTSIFSSGTVNAALRASGVNLAPVALALSWDLPASMYLHTHPKDANLDDYAYPEKSILPLLRFLLSEDFLHSPLVNVNFPQQESHDYRITEVYPDITKVFDYSQDASDQALTLGHYSYASSRRTHEPIEQSSDVGAINAGYISISPCTTSLNDHEAFAKVHRKTGQI